MSLSQQEIDLAVEKSVSSLDEVVGGAPSSMEAVNYFDTVGVHNIKGGGIKKRLVRKSLSAPSAIMKKLTQGYLEEQARVDNSLRDSMFIQQRELSRIGDTITTTLSKDAYETQKLIDGFKKEILAELVDLKAGNDTPKKGETKILHAKRLETLKKVNIGAGRDIRDDYINVDHRQIEGIDVVTDVRELPFATNSLDEIYASHVAEHFLERDFKKILTYWFSLLKSGGCVRLKVPNIDVMARKYAVGEVSWEQLRSVLLGGQDYVSDHHFNHFSVESMEEFVGEVLPRAKFVVIEADRKNGESYEMEVVIEKQDER